MYGYYTYSPETVLNQFLYVKLKEEGLLVPSDYVWTPIIPVNQVSEFNNMNGEVPFIVYSVSEGKTGSDWFMDKQYIAYVIYSTNESKVRAIGNFMADLLGRYDDSAHEINDWAGRDQDSLEVGEVLDPMLKRFRFHQTFIAARVPLEPYTEDNGRYNGMITIGYEHVVPRNEAGMRDFISGYSA